jgi:hypothetical protein
MEPLHLVLYPTNNPSILPVPQNVAALVISALAVLDVSERIIS